MHFYTPAYCRIFRNTASICAVVFGCLCARTKSNIKIKINARCNVFCFVLYGFCCCLFSVWFVSFAVRNKKSHENEHVTIMRIHCVLWKVHKNNFNVIKIETYHFRSEPNEYDRFCSAPPFISEEKEKWELIL